MAGSVAAAIISQVFASGDRRRDNYADADAVAVLVAWCEYPYVIRRRTGDDPQTLERIAQRGHDLQERISRSETWVTTENKKMGKKYSALVAEVKSAAGPLIDEAWKSASVTTAADMVLNGWGRDECGNVKARISEFGTAASNRFGWRRLLRD